MKDQSSFTLIELLIVIGILAILVASVIVILNPAQLLAQARDSKRQQDLSALNQALQTITALDQTLSFGSSSVVYTSLPDSSSTCGSWGLPSLPSGWNYHCVSTTTLQNTDGTGWIPVNFKTTGVVSLSALPTDPQNTSSTGLYYTYVTGGSYELTALFESSKYRSQQTAQASQSNSVSGAYLTVGSNLTVNPLLSSQGLVGWWQLNDGSGTTVTDSSGNNANGVLSGSPSWSTGAGCQVGGCVLFNGSTNYISGPSSTQFEYRGGDFSISAWFYVNSLSALNRVFMKWWDSTTMNWGMYFNSTSIGVVGEQSSSQYVYCPASASVQTGQWLHVVGVFDSVNHVVRVYVNGQGAASCANSLTSWTPSSNTNRPLFIGAYNPDTNGTFQVFNGRFDDMRVYAVALSDAQVQALYNATK